MLFFNCCPIGCSFNILITFKTVIEEEALTPQDLQSKLLSNKYASEGCQLSAHGKHGMDVDRCGS